MALILKVELPALGVSKSMRFMQDIGVEEAIREIKAKTEQGGDDHGLLVPAHNGEPACWLRSDRTLGHYELENNQTVCFRKKHQMVKVKLLDDSVKTFLLDTAVPIEKVVEDIGGHLGIKHPEEFALMKDGEEDHWLVNESCLVEQGWEDGAIVVFKKKFFFSDQYVDKDDPMALHLLFLQSRGTILSGENPVVRDEAIQLTSMLLQVEQQDFSPEKAQHLEWRKLLPRSMWKEKNLDKEVIKAWRGLVGTVELNAKYRYVQLCRSLKTYGITTFEVMVEEQAKATKKKGKSARPTPVLFGVTRDRVCFMDPVTRETKRRAQNEDSNRGGQPMIWKLTKIKRWAAAPQTNSITFDFGDHESNYLVLKTKECRKISELIAGYIDIILKNRRDAAKALEDQAEERATVSEMARPQGFASMSYTMAGVGGGPQIVPGGLGGAQFYSIETRPPIVDGKTALGAMMNLFDDFDNSGYKVPSTFSMDDFNRSMSSAITTTNKSVKRLTNMKDISRSTFDANAKQLALDGEQLVLAARNAALSSTPGNMDLLAASKTVAGSLKELLALMDIAADHSDIDYSDPLNVLRKNYDAGIQALMAAREAGFKPNNSSELILEAGKAVALALDLLAQDCNGTDLEDAGAGLKATGRSIEQASGTLADAMLIPNARREIRKANQAASKYMDAFASMAKASGIDKTQLASLLAAALSVKDALALLNNGIEASEVDSGNLPDFKGSAERLMTALENLKSGKATRADVIQATKDVAASSNQIVLCAQGIAAVVDESTRGSLLAAAKACADAVSKLVAAAKGFTSDMGNEAKFATLAAAADAMIGTGQDLADSTRRAVVMAQIRAQAKDAAAAGISLVQASRGGSPSIHDDRSKEALLKAASDAANAIDALVGSVKHLTRDTSDKEKQDATVQAAQAMAAQTMSLAATARRVSPKITDLLSKADVKDAGKRAAEAMSQLLETCKSANSSTEQEIEAALESLESTSSELDALDALVQSGLATGDVSRSNALSLMNHATKQLADQTQRLAKAAASRPQGAGEAAGELCVAMAQVAASAKAVCSSTKDKSIQGKVLSTARALNFKTEEAIRAALVVAVAGGAIRAGPVCSEDLLAAARNVADALADLIAASRGLDTSEVDSAVKDIMSHVSNIGASITAPEGKSLDSAVEDVVAASRTTSGAMSQVVAMAKGDAKNFGGAARVAASTIPALVDTTNVAAALATSPEMRSAVITATRRAVEGAASALKVALAAAATGDPSSHANLLTASKLVADSLADLLGTLGQDSDGGIDDALSTILAAAAILDKLHDYNPPPGTTIGGSVSELLAEMSNLAHGTSSIVAAARSGPTQLGKAAQNAADSVQKIVSSAMSAVKASPSSAPPEFVKAAQLVDALTHQLVVNAADPKKLNVVARGLAASTAKLIQLSKASATGLASEQKALLERSTQALAQGTAKLAQAAKAIQGKAPDAQADLDAASRHMNEQTAAMLTAVSSSSDDAQSSSDPALKRQVTDSTRAVATVAGSLVRAALAAQKAKDDPDAQKELSSSANSMTDSIRALIKSCGKLQPGSVEFDEGYERIQSYLGDVDSASISVAVGSFEAVETSKSHQQCQEELVQVAKTLATDVSSIVNASRIQSSSTLGRTTQTVGAHVSELVELTMAAISTTTDHDLRASLLAVAKSVAEALLGLLDTARSSCSSGNKDEQRIVASRAKDCTTAVGQLVNELKSGVVLLRDIDESLALVSNAQKLAKKGAPKAASGGSYQAAKDDVSDLCRHMAGQVKRLVGTDKGNMVQLGSVTKDVAADIMPLVVAALQAAAYASADVDGLKDALIQAARRVAASTHDLVQAAKYLAEDPKNTALKRGMTTSFEQVSAALAKLMSEAKRGAVGEQRCDSALESISQVIGDLGSSALYAAAGQLEVDDSERSSFGKNATSEVIGEAVIQASKHLVVASQQLVGVAGSGTLEQFGTQAQAEAKATYEVGVAAKVLASVQADMSVQQSLLNAAKAAAQAVQGLVMSSKDAVRSGQDQSVQRAMASSSEMVAQCLHSLMNLATQYASDDGGVGAMVNAIKNLQGLIKTTEAAGQEGNNIMPLGYEDKLNAVAEDVVQSCREVSASIVKLTQAATNKDGQAMGAAANEANKHAELLLTRAVGSAISTAPNAEVRQAVVNAARSCASGTVALLSACKDQATTGVAGTAIQESSEAMADCVQQVVAAARGLPGGAGLKLQIEAGGDVESKAGKELDAAAAAIQRAMQTLLETQARKPRIPSVSIDTTSVTEAILSAALMIAEATHKLVICSSVCQSERLANQAANPMVYNKDPMWANGLISAAKAVAGSTQQLVKSANRAVTGEAEDEELPAVAKTVAEATAHLVTASRAKADANSASVFDLGKAARIVAQASAKLVEAAREAAQIKEDEELQDEAATMTGSTIAKIEQHMRVLKAEKELEKARAQMGGLNKSRYAGKS